MFETNLIDPDQESEDKMKQIKEIFTLENATEYYKQYSDNNRYKCSWVSGMEGELIQFTYKSGNELVVERLHIDDLEDAGDWENLNYKYGTEMMFSLKDLVKLTNFMVGE